MQSAAALATALGMLNCPRITRRASRSPLPKGVTLLLEVAAGDSEALHVASSLTGRPEESLRKGADFFIEQVLLCADADHYRVLGCRREASQADLRRHMALIMRWLHPDIVSGGGKEGHFNKALYADRVTQAWETIKTKERRAAYDALLANAGSKQRRKSNCGPSPLVIPPVTPDSFAIARSHPKRHRASNSPERRGFWNRIRLFVFG